jgi:hypothetical protein
VASFPADRAGLDGCAADDDSCQVRVDTKIEFRFDRFLLPASINRQAIAIYTGTPDNRVGNQLLLDAPAPVYDVVERVVTVTLGEGEFLQPHTLYTVELLVRGEGQPYGFRAFDGAPLEPGATPLRFSFYTSSLNPEDLPATDPNAVEPDPEFTCSDILLWFGTGTNQGQCTACHEGPEAAMGLELLDGSDILSTAWERAAHQTDVGGVTGQTFEDPRRFGVGMPRIDPKQPNNSYLLYKLLINPRNFRRSPTEDDVCETAHPVALGQDDCVPSDAEIERLREWFVRGEPMPFDSWSAPGASLYRSKLRGIQSWIRAGAPCE